MARRKKTHAQIADIARARHERLYQLAQQERGQPGITKRRFQVSNALHERMRAELKAREERA